MAANRVSSHSIRAVGPVSPSFYSENSRSCQSFQSTQVPPSPQRWTLCVFCCLAFAIITFKNALTDEITFVMGFGSADVNATSGCPIVYAGREWRRQIDLPSDLPEFLLNPQSIPIDNAIYYAVNLLAVVPAGVISDLGYPRSVLGAGVLLMAVHHILMPKFGRFGYKGYVILTCLQGIGEALTFPSVFSLISRNSPPSERNFFTALVVAGFYYGFLLGHLFFNFIFVKYKLSWTFGNLTIGVISLAWLIGWSVVAQMSKGTSELQREDRLTFINRLRRFWIRLCLRLRVIRWRQILFSRPLLSLLLVYYALDYCYCIAYYNFYLVLILYQKYILHIPPDVAHYSNLMVTAYIPSSFISALFADWVIKKKYTSKTVIKRAFAAISVFSSAILQVIVPLVGCNLTLFWIIVTTDVFVAGLALPLLYSNPIDLSFRHVGLLSAFMYGFRSIAIIFDNYVIQNLYPDLDFGNSHYWRNAFFGFAVVGTISCIPYLFFGSGETQHWNRPMPRHVRRVERPPIAPETSS